MGLIKRRIEVWRELRFAVILLTSQMGRPKLCVPVSIAGTHHPKNLWQLDLNKTLQGWTGDGQQQDQGAKEQPSSASHSNCGGKAQLSEGTN